MHIARQTPQELVIVDGSRWISAICAAAAVLTAYQVLSHHEPKGLLAAAVFVLFALIMDLRKTFTFDGMQRIVRWKGRTILKSESGEIPFDDITDIGTQVSSTTVGPSQRHVPTYRLTIVTPQATIPMAYSYSGQTDRYSVLRSQILEYIRHGSTT